LSGSLAKISFITTEEELFPDLLDGPLPEIVMKIAKKKREKREKGVV